MYLQVIEYILVLANVHSKFGTIHLHWQFAYL